MRLNPTVGASESIKLQPWDVMNVIRGHAWNRHLKRDQLKGQINYLMLPAGVVLTYQRLLERLLLEWV